MCLLIESQCSEEMNRGDKKEKKVRGGELLFINSVYFKQAVALLVLIAATSESSYSATGQFCIIYDGNESQAALEERCIANDVADASLRNRRLGKQRIKRSTRQEENESKTPG